MVLNLEKIVPSPCSSSTGVQQNITDMKQYSAAISDLTLSGKEYRGRRVLRKTAATDDSSGAAGPVGVADIVRLVPAQVGAHEGPKRVQHRKIALRFWKRKSSLPIWVPAPQQKLAPQVELASGENWRQYGFGGAHRSAAGEGFRGRR